MPRTLRAGCKVNYFEYFSEIEERFNARRGTLLLLSTLDWALIETWREAGVPLAAVLRGIDDAFDKYDARKSRAKGRLAKVNGLAWCAQAVMQAATELAEAQVGARAEDAATRPETGFEAERVLRFLHANANALQALRLAHGGPALSESLAEAETRLRGLAETQSSPGAPSLEDLDRALSVTEERLQAALLTAVPETDLLAAREAADREMAIYRGRLPGTQMRQLRDQFVHKRLFDQWRLPRLSLFYMPLDAEEPPSPGPHA